jgi:hypothetical protein
VDQVQEETWDTVGGTTERSISPAPSTRVTVPEGAHVEDEATTEAGIVDVASILSTPTVTVVRSSL